MLKKHFEILEALNPLIIFEFGAFDGTDTLSYRRSFPEATIYSFEPDRVLYRAVRAQMKKNDIHFYNYAISDITGEADFHYLTGVKNNRERSPAGSLYPYTADMQRSQGRFWKFPSKLMKVKCVTIKDFCHENNIPHIDYMHMDVEGAVDKVLGGMGELRPTIILAETSGRDALFQGAPSQMENNKLFDALGYEPDGAHAADIMYKLKTEK